MLLTAPVLVLDAAGRVTFVNPAFERRKQACAARCGWA